MFSEALDVTGKESTDRTHSIIQLKSDNTNQREWMDSVVAVASAIGGYKFLSQGRAYSRLTNQDDLLDNRNFGVSKKETGLEAQPTTTESTTSSKEAQPTTTAKPPASGTAGKGEESWDHIDLGSYVPPSKAQSELLSRQLGRNLRVFLNDEGKDEDQRDHMIRFRLFLLMKKSVPHHHAKLTLCQQGNCYQLMTLVIVNFQLTGLTLYKLHKALFTEISFTSKMSIADLVRQISDLALRAGSASEGGFHPGVLRGCLLENLRSRPEFDHLRKQFTLSSSTETFNEIVDELYTFEQNNTRAHFHKQELGAEATEKDLQLALAALIKQYSAKSGKGDPRKNSRRADGTPINEQVCRNYIRGVCRNHNCPRIHDDTKSLATTDGVGERLETRKCYNCQTVCGSLAANCKNPKASAIRNTSTTGRVASAAVEDGASSPSLAQLVEELQQVFPNADVAHHNQEGASMMREWRQPRKQNRGYGTASAPKEEIMFTAQGVSPAVKNEALVDCAATSHFLPDDMPFRVHGQMRTDQGTKIGTASEKQTPLESLGRVDGLLHTERCAIPLENAAVINHKELRQPLISVGQLTEVGYVLLFVHDKCVIFDPALKPLDVIQRVNHVYPLSIVAEARTRCVLSNAQSVAVKKALGAVIMRMHETTEKALGQTQRAASEAACLAKVYFDKKNLKMVLHRRFHHAAIYKGGALYEACARLYGKQFTEAPDFMCTDCYVAKAHRLPHPRHSLQEKQKRAGDGPHGVIFIDCFSWPFPGERGERYGTVIYNQRFIVPLAHKLKSDAPTLIVEQLKRLLKRQEGPLELGPVRYFEAEELEPTPQTWKTMRQVTSDGASEYMNGALVDFCRAHGIIKHASCPYTQSQNQAENAVKIITQGIAVNMHQMGRGKPRKYWVRAMHAFAAAYSVLPNKTPKGEYLTPYESLHQVHVPWEKLIASVHPFGCLCFALIPRQVRAHTHAVDKAIRCWNAGPSMTKAGHAVVTLESGILLDGVHDVFFNESVFPMADKAERSVRAKESEGGVETEQEQQLMEWELNQEADMAGRPGAVGAPQCRMPAQPESVIKEQDAAGQKDNAHKEREEHVQQIPADEPPPLDEFTGENMMPANSPAQVAPAENLAVSPPQPATLPEPQPAESEEQGPATQLENAFERALRPFAIEQAGARGEEPGPQLPRRSSRVRKMSVAVLEGMADQDVPPPTVQEDSTADAGTELGCAAQGSAQAELRNALQIASASPSSYSAIVMTQDQLRQKCERASAAVHLFDLRRAPTSRAAAARRPDAEKWLAKDESGAEGRHVQKVTKLGLYQYEVPNPDDIVMNGMWVYVMKVRAHSNGELEESARYTGIGTKQIPGVDCGETHCPTSSYESFLIDEARAANDPEILREVWDVVGAFYHALRDKRFRQFIRPPPGYEKYNAHGRALMWRLLKCIPGARDSGHYWNEQFTTCLITEAKLKVSPVDAAVFTRTRGEEWISIKFHVDDAGVHSNSQALTDKIYETINRRFPMKRAAGIDLMLGVTITRSPKGIEFSQLDLIEDIWELANLGINKKVKTPFPASFTGFNETDMRKEPKDRKLLDKYPYSQLVGKLGYVKKCTRPDIGFEVATLRRFLASYGPKMIDALEHLIQFLYGTRQQPLCFRAGYTHSNNVVAMVDSSYASCKFTRTSHGGFCIFYLGCLISCKSRRQKTVALSTMEAEFVEAFHCAKELVHIEKLLEGGVGEDMVCPVPVLEDNSSAIFLSLKPNLQGERTRHMDVKYHYLQTLVREGLLELKAISTLWQVADICTKNVPFAIRDRLAPLLMGHAPLLVPAVIQAIEEPSRVIAVRGVELRPVGGEKSQSAESVSMMRELENVESQGGASTGALESSSENGEGDRAINNTLETAPQTPSTRRSLRGQQPTSFFAPGSHEHTSRTAPVLGQPPLQDGNARSPCDASHSAGAGAASTVVSPISSVSSLQAPPVVGSALSLTQFQLIGQTLTLQQREITARRMVHQAYEILTNAGQVLSPPGCTSTSQPLAQRISGLLPLLEHLALPGPHGGQEGGAEASMPNLGRLDLNSPATSSTQSVRSATQPSGPDRHKPAGKDDHYVWIFMAGRSMAFHHRECSAVAEAEGKNPQRFRRKWVYIPTSHARAKGLRPCVRSCCARLF